MKRGFSRKERIALFLAADGRSELSGEELGENWHADHITPWSHGGPTDLENGQALTAEENIRKGNRYMLEPLRNWQLQFIDKYRQHADADFLLAALPGGGKTRAALHVAAEFTQVDRQRRVIIVVPTLNIRDQWYDEARTKYGLRFQTKEFVGDLKEGFHGAIATYAAVANNSYLYRRLTSKHPCLVIFDEVHHAGDQSAWGNALLYAFENAQKRLSLSGTPFKHDGQRIPFLKVEPDGFYRVDFPYDYPTALEDGVIRFVTFKRYDGSLDIGEPDGTSRSVSTETELNEEDGRELLRELIDHHRFLKSILGHAHDQLMQVRQSRPNAAALAICMDTRHALKVADHLRTITGEEPDIVLSDEEAATSSVKAFRASDRKWIVAVRMVSEGVDIKRLMVLAYLTHFRTAMSFRQAIGRIMRNEQTEVDMEAFCLMPNDPVLSQHAKEIEEFQRIIVERDDETEETRTRSQNGNDNSHYQITVLDSSMAEFAGITTRGEHYGSVPAAKIESLAKEYQIPAAVMARVMKDPRIVQPHTEVRSTTSPAAEDIEADMDRLRRQCNSLAFKIAKRQNVDVKEIHGEACRIWRTNQGQMSTKQLQEKIQWLLKRLGQL